jgi:ribosome-associated protein
MRENEGMSVAGVDLRVPPGPGLPQGLVIPADELVERFSRSQGPGGQGVNTTDSRVELLFDLAASTALTQTQRSRLRQALGARLVDGRVVVTASEHRSQLRNRAAARERLVALLREGLAPPPHPRLPAPAAGDQAAAGRGQGRKGSGPA